MKVVVVSFSARRPSFFHMPLSDPKQIPSSSALLLYVPCPIVLANFERIVQAHHDYSLATMLPPIHT